MESESYTIEGKHRDDTEETSGVCFCIEEALWESKNRYRQLLASVTDYIYTIKVRDGQILSTFHGPGCEKVTGYTSDEYANDPYLWHRMVHEEDRDAVVGQAVRRIDGDTSPLEHRIIHKDGSLRWVKNMLC